MTNHEHLLELFHNILKKMKKKWHNQLDGLTPTQYHILKKLASSGPQKATELAEVIQITPGAITGASDKLVTEGLAQRRGVEEDRRVVYLEITETGKRLVETLIKNHKKVTAQFFSGLPEEDIRHLIRIYDQLSANLDRLDS